MKNFTEEVMVKIIPYPSVNFNDRPEGTTIDCVVIHYTDVATLQETFDLLTNPKREASCHYLIDVDGTIYQLVADEKRAWHAGPSSLMGCDNVNHFSIGIELQNGGYYAGYALTGFWPPFPDDQIDALNQLLLKLMKKFPITPDRIVGHDDIVPDHRKIDLTHIIPGQPLPDDCRIDPGPAFPWEKVREYIAKF